MGRSALIAAVAAFAIALVVSQSGCFWSDSGSSGNRSIDGGYVCTPGDNFTACPAGFTCVNRNCAGTCTGGTGCDAGYFCEGADAPRNVCVPTTPRTCASYLDCPLPQICYQGFCSAAEDLADGGTSECDPQASPTSDKCPPDALCFPVQSQTTGNVRSTCIAMMNCAPDNTCPPIPNYGIVCNDKAADAGAFYPGKAKICLFTYCQANANCSTNAHCFRKDQAADLGQCFYGTVGDPCRVDGDCPNTVSDAGALKCLLADGGGLDAGELGFCQ